MAAGKPKSKPNVSAEELLQYYKDMLLIRRFEEKAGQLWNGSHWRFLPSLHRSRGGCGRA